jgi:cytochrome oxidase Cu insertion factor (SCO1/SenC/PrrC family)
MRSHHKLLPVLFAVAIAALALAVTVTVGGSSGGAGDSTRAPSSSGEASSTGFDGALLPAGGATHGFTLTDQDGRRVSLSSVRGQVAILAFLSCASRTTAPLIAQQIRGALDQLDPGVPALAVSVDPETDTPACVRAFLDRVSLAGRLEYLTGTPARLRAVWRAYSVVPVSAGKAAYERSAFVLLLDRAGAKRVELPLEELTPEGLARDLRKLRRE